MTWFTPEVIDVILTVVKAIVILLAVVVAGALLSFTPRIDTQAQSTASADRMNRPVAAPTGAKIRRFLLIARPPHPDAHIQTDQPLQAIHVRSEARTSRQNRHVR